MKRLLRTVGRIAALAAAIALVSALIPYAGDLLSNLLPRGKYERFSVLLTHEMEETGDLTAVRYTDTGVMEARTNAFLIGTVQTVKAPYTYEIGLGVSLKDVTLTVRDDGLVAAVPAARMIYDSFRITGEAEIHDFWKLLSQDTYQKMQDEQHDACRQEYLDDEEKMQQAWDAACEMLDGLFAQWTGEKVPIRFVPAGQAEEPS